MKWVLAVQNKAQLKAFIDFPHELYKEDPCYVPELFIAQRDLLTPGKHPFHEHSRVRLFLAYQDNKIVGRIAAIYNVNHNTFNQTADGFFGFFDCVNDAEVSRRLFHEAEQWLTEQGAKSIAGPANFSTNETCGLLIEGFDTPPFVMMPYNKAYYGSLLDQLGFRKKVDLIAYRFGADGYDDKAVRLNDMIRKRLANKGIVIRPVNKANFKYEVERIRDVYNTAWDKNLGFVPMTNSEFDYMAKDIKLILDTDFCMVAEQDGKVIGFALAIPDINQILIKIRRGRLLPLGLFKLLLGLKKVNGIRVLALGVVEGYRKLGIEGCFYASIIEAYRRRNFKRAEASWILEDNEPMNKAMEHTKGKPYKRYRIFEKAI
jgi:GNAT superfamily N-acetyltransferase